MKFFTPDLYKTTYHDDDDDDSGWDAFEDAKTRYAAHVERVRDKLPRDVLVLIDLDLMHDGLLVDATYEAGGAILSTTFRCGWVDSGRTESGYYDLALVYEGAQISEEHLQVLETVARGTKTSTLHRFDAHCHELELFDTGELEHRLIFHHVGGAPVWYSVKCSRLGVQVIPQPNRELPKLKKRFKRI